MLCVALAGCASSGQETEVASLPEDAGEARALVERFDAVLLDIARRSGELGQSGREAEVRSIALDSFDVPAIARSALGSHWEQLTPEQRLRWTQTYTEFHVVAIAFNWRSSADARIVYLGEEVGPNDTLMVESRLDRAGSGFHVRRDYRLRRTPDGWRIIDVFSPGAVSNVGMRRSEYLAVLARTSFDGLIEDMERRIEVRRRG